MTLERLAEIAARIPAGEHPWRLEPRIVAWGPDAREQKEGFEIWTATEAGDWVVAEVHDEWAPDQDGGGDEDGTIVTAIDATHDVHPNAASIAQFILHARDDMAWLVAEVARLNDQSNSFAETIRVAGEMVANRDDRINRLTQNHARAAHDLDMWLDLHETEPGSAGVASAREKLDGVAL